MVMSRGGTIMRVDGMVIRRGRTIIRVGGTVLMIAEMVMRGIGAGKGWNDHEEEWNGLRGGGHLRLRFYGIYKKTYFSP